MISPEEEGAPALDVKKGHRSSRKKDFSSHNAGDHIFGVIRHTERADAPFAAVTPGMPRWTQSPDFANWPFDPPLSEEGKKAADEIGKRVLDFSKRCGTKVSVIVSSPYTRCLQTASRICAQLDGKIIVDNSLGEIFGPSIMGSTEPKYCVRGADEALTRTVRKRQLIRQPRALGSWPKWPEEARAARHRFATRFLTYLQRSLTTKRNFLLVTHADCVGAALGVMPSHCGRIVEKIEYGGMFLARHCTTSTLGSRLTKLLGISLSRHKEEEPQAESEEDFDDALDMPDSGAVQAPQPGWQVACFGVKMNSLTSNHDGLFEKRAKSLEKKSSFSQEKIRELLGHMDAAPLGDSETAETDMSDSTRIFGLSSCFGSENAMSAQGASMFSPAASTALQWRSGASSTKDTAGANKIQELRSNRISRCKEIIGEPADAPVAVPVAGTRPDLGKSSLLARRGLGVTLLPPAAK